MNRIFTKSLVLALLVVTVLSGCTKSASDVLMVTDNNMVGTYTIVSITASAPGVPVQDVTTKTLTPCQLDNQVILRNDYTSIYVDAGTKCTPDGGYSDYWELNGNILTVTGQDFTVRSLTRSTLVLEQVTTVTGITVTSTFTYRKN